MNITVVGAGVVGCAIAHELASRGAHVRVLDARGTGLGATHASAGILAPHTEGHIPGLLTLGARSLSLYGQFIERIVSDGGQPVEYDCAGTLQVAANADDAEHLSSAARALTETHVHHVLLDGAQARALEPAIRADVVAALHITEQGYVAAGALTRGLAAAAARRGATFETAPVLAIEGGEAVRVTTAQGVHQADIAIVAAGSWSGTFTSAAKQQVIKPIRGQLLQLRLPARPSSHVLWSDGCYLVPWRDGTVLAGATVEDVGFDENATTTGVRQLLDAAVALMPALRNAAFEGVRVGLRPMTADELPAIGPSSTMRQVFYATGHYRNGVLLAPLTARLVADLVLDGRRDELLGLTRPDRLGL